MPTKHQRYFHRNKVRRTYEAALARADGLGAVPSWLDDEQKNQFLEIYDAAEALHIATGIPHEVDHMVQLVGKNKAGEQVICGLHVPWNLRAIPWKMNVTVVIGSSSLGRRAASSAAILSTASKVTQMTIFLGETALRD